MSSLEREKREKGKIKGKIGSVEHKVSTGSSEVLFISRFSDSSFYIWKLYMTPRERAPVMESIARKEDPHLEEVESREGNGDCTFNTEPGMIALNFHT